MIFLSLHLGKVLLVPGASANLTDPLSQAKEAEREKLPSQGTGSSLQGSSNTQELTGWRQNLVPGWEKQTRPFWT